MILIISMNQLFFPGECYSLVMSNLSFPYVSYSFHVKAIISTPKNCLFPWSCHVMYQVLFSCEKNSHHFKFIYFFKVILCVFFLSRRKPTLNNMEENLDCQTPSQ